MKILIVSQYYYPERVSVNNVAEEFVKLGNEVTVITGKPNYGFNAIPKDYKHTKKEIINGVKVYRVNLCPRKHGKLSIIFNYLSFHDFAKNFVRRFKEKFDVVLSFSLSPIISVSPAILYGKKFKVPVVLYCEDLWPESPVIAGMIKDNSLAYQIIDRWSKSIYKRVDKIIISSPSFKSYFTDVLKIENKGFKTIYQPTLSSDKKCDPIQYKNKHNIVYAGNIGELQNVELIVAAMQYVKTKDVMLHLLGVGSNLKRIKAQIEEEDLTNVITYDGAYPIEKTESFFANADALIMSLKTDGYVGKTIPNKAIQYMKYSKPIIASIFGDGRELLAKANGSLLCDENPQSIARKIDEICSMSSKEKDVLGKNNFEYFKNNFETQKIAKQMLIELKSAIKK